MLNMIYLVCYIRDILANWKYRSILTLTSLVQRIFSEFEF